jgi:MerR family transcriptional regulator, light-induced transcriptional regulator
VFPFRTRTMEQSAPVPRPSSEGEEAMGQHKSATTTVAVHANAAPGDLMQTIERDIIPRLVLAHRDEALASCVDSRPPPTNNEIAAFGRLVTVQNLSTALEVIDELARQGLALESILLDLVGKTARWLGEQWLEDAISFADVTAGLGTLQQIVNVLGPSFNQAVPSRGMVLLTTTPGEQHTLGLFLLGEFLRRAGWGVDVVPGLTPMELSSYLTRSTVEVVGFTVCRDELLPSLARSIEVVRKESRNPDLDVIIGGRIDLTGFASQHGVTALESPTWAVRWLDERGPRARRVSRSSSP